MLWALAALSLLAQTTPKNLVTKPNSDTWERSKECASQAEKVMADHKDLPNTLTTWENHYSPKYKRCFLAVLDSYVLLDGHGKDFATYHWRLLDAFERSLVAMTAWDGPPLPADACTAEGESLDCQKVRSFIQEHMKN